MVLDYPCSCQQKGQFTVERRVVTRLVEIDGLSLFQEQWGLRSFAVWLLVIVHMRGVFQSGFTGFWASKYEDGFHAPLEEYLLLVLGTLVER